VCFLMEMLHSSCNEGRSLRKNKAGMVFFPSSKKIQLIYEIFFAKDALRVSIRMKQHHIQY
jgi:hypothetical protein